MDNMKLILKWEDLALFVLSAYTLYDMHVQWWVYLLLFLGPDISMLGYAAVTGPEPFRITFFITKALPLYFLLQDGYPVFGFYRLLVSYYSVIPVWTGYLDMA